MTLREEIESLKETAKLRAEISNSLEGYIEGLKRAKAVDQEINRLRKIESDVQAKIQAAIATGNVAEEARQKSILDLLQKQTDVLEEQNNILKDNLKTVNKTNLLMAKGAASMVKAVANLPNLIESGYGKIKSLGLFDMDKAIRKSALSMGLMTNETNSFRSDIKAAADDTLVMGVGIEELAKYQSDYSEALGRTVMLNKEGLKAMADMAAATALGAEGAASLAADFEQQGLSAERTRDFVEQTMNDSHKMGLNASKVIKNIQQNFKLLNKYNFKGGIKGLEKMAETTTKLGIDMNSVTGMADKLFDIEGAVDMSAQLQVMGGEWSKMADPFHLMYMARNDIAGLTEELGNAAASSAHFNAENGEFEISALELHRLRKIAEQTGVEYDTLATAAKNAAKFTKIKSQISISVPDKDTQEFLTNTAKFDNGKAYIEMKDADGKLKKRYLNELNNSDALNLKTQIEQKKTLEQYAKDSRTFDDALMNFINQLKVKLLPFVEVLNDKLIPKLDGWVKSLKDGKWLEKIENFAKFIGGVVSNIAGFVMDNPKWTIALIGLAKGFSFLAEKANWIANGFALAEGFNIGTLGSGGMGAAGKMFGAAAGGLLALSIGTALAAGAGSIYDKVVGEKKKSDTWSNNWLKKLGRIGTTTAVGAGGGAAVGALGLGIGAVPGAIIGGVGGLGKGLYDEFISEPTQDGVIPAGYQPKQFDKGTAILKNGTINPINNKDDLLTMKPDGPVARKLGTADNSNTISKIEFGEISINGKLIIESLGNPNMGVDLLKNQPFMNELSQTLLTHIDAMVHQKTKG